jgi:peroxiredoxin
VQGVDGQIKELGGDVLVVSFASAAHVATYLDTYPQPFPVVADPTRAAYRAFGLGSTTFKAMLRPGTVARYLGMIFRGWLPTRPAANDDLLQLGGDFVLDADGRVRFAHPSGGATDRPSAQEIVDAVRQIAAPA